jgi:hypothetical protein
VLLAKAIEIRFERHLLLRLKKFENNKNLWTAHMLELRVGPHHDSCGVVYGTVDNFGPILIMVRWLRIAEKANAANAAKVVSARKN